MFLPDKIDKAIIRELMPNARITITELASRVGLSKTPCQLRIKRLEEQGYILGYETRVNLTKLELNHIAFVQVSMSNTSRTSLKKFNEAMKAIPEIEQCHMIAGGFDYLLKVRTTNMSVFRTILGDKISTLPDVVQTSTFVVMESVKEGSLEFSL